MTTPQRISTFNWPSEATDDVEITTYVLDIPSPREWPKSRLGLDSDFFILFVAADFHRFSIDEWSVFVRNSLDAGCAYVCAWGEGCENLHDLFDSALTATDPLAASDRFVMTTWHAHDSIESALWFALFCARPPDDTRFFGRTAAVLACSLGNKHYAQRLALMLADPLAFHDEVVGEEDD
jgi:hypothetical protein